jgi:hypothetical protein
MASEGTVNDQRATRGLSTARRVRRRWFVRPTSFLVISFISVTLGSLFAVAHSAHAQEPSTSDRESARTLMQEGDARRDHKDYKGALESYRAADAIMHVTSTGLAVGRMQIELGELVEARDKLSEVARIAAKPNESPVLAEARGTAQALGEEVEARVPGLRVSLRGVPEGVTPTLNVDGANIPSSGQLGYHRLNPGRHVVLAHAGSVDRREEIVLKERERRDLALDLSPPSAPAIPSSNVAPPIQEATPPTSPPKDANQAASSTGPWKTLAWVGFGIGGVGIVAGTVTGLMSIAHTNSAKDVPVNEGGCNPQGQCGQPTWSDIDAAKTTGTISTVAFIVGGAGVVLGIVSVIMNGKANAERGAALSKAPYRMRLEPWISPGAGGVRGVF